MTITYSQLKENLTKTRIEFTDEEFLTFVDLIKMPECDEVRASDLETLSIAEWRTNLGCLNMVTLPLANKN
jgi:hypothetical protein